MVRRSVVPAIAVAAVIGISTAGVLTAHSDPSSAPQAASSSSVGAAAATQPVQATITPGVAPLRHLAQPDVFITADRYLSTAKLTELRKAVRARTVTVFDVGTLRVGGRLVRALGVDPAPFRGFTPPPTAASDQLWENVAQGDVVASYAVARTHHLRLGTPVTMVSRTARTQRVGAFAAFGFPLVDVVMNRSSASALGLRVGVGVILSAPGRSATAITRAARRVLGPRASIVALREDAPSHAGKPRTYRELYQAAARTCPGLSWTILAAIGQVESGHGVNVGPSSAGALGPMQFMPATWKVWARDGDGDRKGDIMNPYDAVYAAAAYLCHNGAGLGGKDLERALFAYNHADWYVAEVLALARLYR